MLVASRFFSLLCSLAERWSRASSCSKRLDTFGVPWILATVRFVNLALPGTMRLHSAKVERISASLTELHEKAGLPALLVHNFRELARTWCQNMLATAVSYK